MGTEQGEFWSRVASRYDEVVDRQIGAGTRSLVRDRLAEEGRLGDLVEFGCGTGFYTSVLAEKADSVVASDVSPGMLTLARERITAPNVTFQVEDCHQTSFPDGAFDTAFMSLVLHFTEPDRALAEVRRVLRPGGTLIILNLDLLALRGVDRVRALVRIVYQGFAGYRVKPPKRLGRNMLTRAQLCAVLGTGGFEVECAEVIAGASRSSNIPVDYVRAVKIPVGDRPHGATVVDRAPGPG